jgi:hypothetical protein
MRLERSSSRVLKGAPQFRDRAERGATMGADICLLGVAEQKVEIFCLPGFVEDRRQMCFSRDSSSRFFLHMHMLREEGNRGARERTTTKPNWWRATSEALGCRWGWWWRCSCDRCRVYSKLLMEWPPLMVYFFTPPTTHQPALSITQEP